MNTPSNWATAVLAALVVFSGAACARQPISDEQKQEARERLRAADTNNDGFIDRAEADANLPRVAKRFDTLDANGDGKLSSEEFKAVASKFANRNA